MENTLLQPEPTTVPLPSDAEIMTYLRYTARYAEIAALAAQDALVVRTCEQLHLTVTDEEWQAAGDAFRLEHRLFGSHETLQWLTQQRISVEEWSYGIKVELLRQKLKEHLFGAAVDSHYLSHRDNFRRVALSQILVTDLAEALRIKQILQEGRASFCALALDYSKGKQSQQQGGFVGVQFLIELLPEIQQAIAQVQEGELVGPVSTRLGHHILRIEKWFPTGLDNPAREQILAAFFQQWVQEQQGQQAQAVPSS